MLTRAKTIGSGAREHLLEAAEKLFGQFGFDAVSLRSIGTAAGQANNSAVQYHFRTKERLARAIFERRALFYEQERAATLSKIRAEGKLNDPRALLGAILMPLAGKGEEGAYNYASFLKRLLDAGDYDRLRADVNSFLPITIHIVDLLSQATGLPDAVFRYRLRQGSIFFLNLILDPGGRVFGDPAPFSSWHEKVEAALESTLAALLAPPTTDGLVGDNDASVQQIEMQASRGSRKAIQAKSAETPPTWREDEKTCFDAHERSHVHGAGRARTDPESRGPAH